MFSAEDPYVRSFLFNPLISLGLTGVFRVYNRYYNRDKKEIEISHYNVYMDCKVKKVHVVGMSEVGQWQRACPESVPCPI